MTLRSLRGPVLSLALATLLGGTVAGTTTAPAAAAAASATGAASTVGDVRGRVAGVIDGDTVRVRVGSQVEKVRVIGVDTPELPRECYSTQAKAATTQLIGGRTVVLRSDRTQPNRDRYGRLLRHVVLTDRSLLARRLIVNGFGREMTVGRAYAGRSAYRADQARAQTKKRGL